MRTLFVLCALFVASGCANSQPDPQTSAQVSQSVGVLFTVDGITMYRFGDGRNYHYFAVRTGRPDTVTLSTWTESCGKNCIRHVSDAIQVLAEAPR